MSEYLIVPLGVALAYMGSNYLFNARELGNFNPRALERTPVEPYPVNPYSGGDTVYKEIPEAKVVVKGRGTRVTHAAPPHFL